MFSILNLKLYILENVRLMTQNFFLKKSNPYLNVEDMQQLKHKNPSAPIVFSSDFVICKTNNFKTGE